MAYLNPQDPADALELAEGRLQMMKAWYGVSQAGYDALKSYGVDYKATKAFKDTSLLDHAARVPFRRGLQYVLRYLESVEAAIAGAIRQKQMRLVPVGA